MQTTDDIEIQLPLFSRNVKRRVISIECQFIRMNERTHSVIAANVVGQKKDDFCRDRERCFLTLLEKREIHNSFVNCLQVPPHVIEAGFVPSYRHHR